MALVLNDRVKETSTTTGTGTLDLAGASSGFVTFVAGIVGIGTVTDATPDTLSRDTVLNNSAGNTSKISFSGTLDVFCTMPASKSVYLDSTGNTVNAAGQGFAIAMAVAL